MSCSCVSRVSCSRKQDGSLTVALYCNKITIPIQLSVCRDLKPLDAGSGLKDSPRSERSIKINFRHKTTLTDEPVHRSGLIVAIIAVIVIVVVIDGVSQTRETSQSGALPIRYHLLRRACERMECFRGSISVPSPPMASLAWTGLLDGWMAHRDAAKYLRWPRPSGSLGVAIKRVFILSLLGS